MMPHRSLATTRPLYLPYVGTGTHEADIRCRAASFWTTEQGRVAGWEQLEAAFRKCFRPRTRLVFEQWVDASGAPDLSLVEPRVVADGTRHRLEFKLIQTGPVYRLKLRASVVTDHGTRWLPVELRDR